VGLCEVKVEVRMAELLQLKEMAAFLCCPAKNMGACYVLDLTLLP
jgi:hypothetical protein